MIVGYARVSSPDQKLEVQYEQLRVQGCERIFEDKFTGSDIERPGLQQLLDYVREGDVVVVTKTDRLARNARDALEISDFLRKKEVGLKLLDLGDADINSGMGRMIYTVMSAFAEMERDRIRQRQREGIDRAKELGRHLGRPSKISNPELQEQVKRLLPKIKAEELSKAAAARQVGVDRSTFYRLLALLGE